MSECNLCGKDRKKFNGFVWYSGDCSTELCRSCYMRWMKTKECKSLEQKYEKAKPTTEAWHKKCAELQKAFDVWYYAQGGEDE